MNGKRWKTQPFSGLKMGDVGQYILLPGDPARCELLQEFAENVQEVHYQREIRAVTGSYHGITVSMVSTGMGCASIATVCEELINIGAKVLIRVGGSAALRKEIEPGDLMISCGAMKNTQVPDHYLPTGYPTIPDYGLTQILTECAQEVCAGTQRKVWVGINASNDGYYTETPEFIERMLQMRIQNMEMESAGLFAVSRCREVKAACICGAGTNMQTGHGDKKVNGVNVRQKEAQRLEVLASLMAIERLAKGGMTND